MEIKEKGQQRASPSKTMVVDICILGLHPATARLKVQMSNLHQQPSITEDYGREDPGDSRATPSLDTDGIYDAEGIVSNGLPENNARQATAQQYGTIQEQDGNKD